MEQAQMSEVFTVFYCWQSDTPRRHGRDLIREALDRAADRISRDETVPYRVAVHADTENEPGLCNIPETILRRLREADAIVSDLTFVAVNGDSDEPKYCSNPNVLFELGYAFKAIGPERLICVMNETHGPRANQIFDLAHHRRPIPFTSPNGDVSSAKTVKALSEALERALREVVKFGLSSGYGGDDEVMHQRQRSEIETYWRSISSQQSRGPIVSISFRPKLYREKRWPDAQTIEEAVRQRGAHTDRFNKYPPQPKGNAPMNWGLYNDTYGDPWTLTYAGQFWTEMDIGAYGDLQISNRDALVSPEPPESSQLTDKQWINVMHTLPEICAAFQFMRNLTLEFAKSESVQWSLEAERLDGKWLSFGPHGPSTMGPSKAPTIKRNGEMLVKEFQTEWLEVFADFAKDLCDAFCRDGRVFSRDELKEFRNPAGDISFSV